MLKDHTQLEVDSIIQLLELCLNATYLHFQQVCYQQKQGTAMGPQCLRQLTILMLRREL